ncbi:MAG: M20 family metallopeptidase [Dehalococcoidia bacterium]|jgi:amidohydrolase
MMPLEDVDKLKARVVEEVEAQRDALIDLSLRIHDNPEPGFQEENACAWLGAYLEGRGFAVERDFCGLPTAFRATCGAGRPCVGLLAEYDALAGLGHACGHNIIAASSTGAGVAVSRVLEATGGSVAVIGTPAEEVYGGKAIMAGRGGFAGLDAAMLVHPGSRNAALTAALACVTLNLEYFGREAHAASRPESGINALDALILAFNAIGALRQHIRDSARIHGVITDGGQAPNVVPGHSAAVFLVRAEDESYLEELKDRVLACFQAGSDATGARLEYRWDDVQYAPLRPNRALAEVYQRNLAVLGRVVEDSLMPRPLGSTDMGNVSLLLPAIHPSIAIAPPGMSIHTSDFARIAGSEEGHRGLLDAAKALAMTAVDVLVDADLRRRMEDEFRASLRND